MLVASENYGNQRQALHGQPCPCQARLVEPLGLRMAHGPLPAPLMRLLLLSVEAREVGAARIQHWSCENLLVNPRFIGPVTGTPMQ